MVDSATHRSKHLNSYSLETLNGDPVPGSFSTRRLRSFLPQEGTKLAEEQKLIEERCYKEEQERKRKEADEIAAERQEEESSGLEEITPHEQA